MRKENRILIILLIIFSILSCLSLVSADDIEDSDMLIQDTYIDETSIDTVDDVSLRAVDVDDDSIQSKDITDVSQQAKDIDDLAIDEVNSLGAIDEDCPEENEITVLSIEEEKSQSSSEVGDYSNIAANYPDSNNLGDGDENEFTPIIIVEIDPAPVIIHVFTGSTHYPNGNTFQDIQDAINRAKSGDVIDLGGRTYIGNGTPILINKSIYIFGQGSTRATLNAQNQSSIFIGAKDLEFLTISGVNFINGCFNGDESSGAAINTGSSNVKITNCDFINNHADRYGGAVIIGGNDVEISNCYFENNSAYLGGAITTCGYRNTFSNCNFVNNMADVAGAIYWCDGEGTIDNCNFIKNHATNYASAVMWIGTNGTIKNSNFYNHSVNVSGGAIYWHGSDGKVLNSRFVNNSAKLGGAIYWPAANAFIEKSYFEKNSALNFSGAVYILGSGGRINNSTFANNSANFGGAVTWYAVDGLIANSTFENNSAIKYGGAIIWSAVADTYTNGSIVDSTFVNNVAEAGHAIMWANTHDQCDLSISNTNFKQKSDDTTLNPSLEDLSLQFTLQSYVVYSSTIEGPYQRTSTRFWNGISFLESYYRPSYVIMGYNQSITIEIYNSTGNLVRNFTGLIDSSGRISYDYRDLPDGQYTYKAYHLDNIDFPFVQNEGSFERHHIPTNLMISVTNVTYPQKAIATITASSPGTYKLVIAGTNYNDVTFTESDISNGGGISSKTVTVDLLGAKDNYLASVTYERTDHFEAASNQTRFNVYKAGSSIGVDSTIGYYGEDTTIEYTVVNATHANVVSIKKNSNTLVEGTDYTIVSNHDGKIIVRGLAEGTYTVNMVNVVDNNHSVSSKDFTLTIKPLVDLSIALAVNNQTPLYGDTIAYTITVTNNGPSVAKNIVVNYHIPPVMNVSSPDASYVGGGVWNIASIGVGSGNAATLTLYATVNSLESLINEVNVASEDRDNNSDNNKANSPVVNALPVADMAVNIGLVYDADTLRIGDTLVYTINVANNGPCDACNVKVIDEFNENLLHLVHATLDGEDIEFNGQYIIDSIAKGSAHIISLSFEIIGNGTIENLARVNSDAFDPNEANNIASGLSLYAEPVVDLNIAISVNNQTPAFGDTIAYTITVTNNGPSVATNLIVKDIIPEDMNVSSPDASYVGGGVWNIASIGVGSGNSATLTLYATLNNIGSFVNNVNVVSNQYDSNLNDNDNGISLNALPIVNLDIISTLNAGSSISIDDLITYTVNITNNGPFDATGVEVTGISSSILEFVSAQASVGSYDSLNKIWNIDALNTDDSAILTLTFRVISTGNIPNNFNVKSDGYDPDTSDNAVVGVNIIAKKISTVITGKNMVTKAIDTKVDGKKGQYFSFTLKDGSNRILANKYVQIILNKVVYKVKTDKNGVAKLRVNIKKAGTYTVRIKFVGDSKYSASSSSLKIKVNKQKPKLISSKKKFKAKAKTKKITAKLKTSRGKALKNKKIVFTIKGKKYIAKTNKKGIATAKIKLSKKGTYSCKIKYAGDKTYSAITKKIKVLIK